MLGTPPISPPETSGVNAQPLVLKCVTPVPHFFKDIPADVDIAHHMLQGRSNTMHMQALPNGFLLRADSFATIRDVCARLWQLDVTAPAGVREFGLWDIEVLKNLNNEDPSLLIRGAYLFCEKVVTRKKTDVCKGTDR